MISFLRHRSPQPARGRALTIPLAVGILATVLSACTGRNNSNAGNTGNVGSGTDPSNNSQNPRQNTANSRNAASPSVIDLLEPMRQGAIDVGGPVVDLGEPQSAPFVLPPLPLRVDDVNGDSWASVATRLRLRVPIAQERAPNRIRLRLRRVRARKILALVDGVPVRQALVPEGMGVMVLTLPIVAERFNRDESVIELRFLGVVKTATAPSNARVVGGVRQPMTPPSAPPAAAEIDWVHIARDEQIVARVTDLVADVRIDRTPRRALTFYAPTRLSWVTVLPAHARLRASIAAEGTRGTIARSVRSRVLVETDDMTPLQSELSVRAGSPWQDLSLDLQAFANKTVRITLAAEFLPEEQNAELPFIADVPVPREDTRLAFADPQIVSDPPAPHQNTVQSRHCLFVVVRGLREDRILPVPNERLTTGTFARLLREGAVYRAVASTTRPLASVATMMTGLLPQTHGLQELTDTLDETAPTLASILRDGGVATGLFTDDSWFIGSGLDRGFIVARSCPNDAAICRSDSPLTAATEWLAQQRDRRAMAMVVTRATMFPLDPPRDLMLQIDPTASDGPTVVEPSALTPAAIAQRNRAQPSQREHAVLRYDAALAGLDRSLGQAIDRLGDAQTLAQTTIIVAGDRGNTIVENNINPDFLALQSVASHTLILLRSPGVSPGIRPTIVATRDAVATVLERLGVQSPWTDSFAPIALTADELVASHRLGVYGSLGPRQEPSLRFGEYLALQRGVNLLLIAPDQDPTGQSELSLLRPIATSYAERVLSQAREPERYTSSTRAISDAISQAIRHGTYPSR